MTDASRLLDVRNPSHPAVANLRGPRRDSRLRRWALCAITVCSALVSGCVTSPETVREIGPLEVQSFGRKWATSLKVEKDPITQLHIRDPYLIAYTKSGTAYVLRRENGEILHSEVIKGGSYKLRPPVLLKEHLAYPTTNTLEIFSLRGAYERSFDLRAAIRADPVGERNSVFAPVSSPDGGARMQKVDVTQLRDLPVWELQVWKGTITSNPALYADAIYFASDDGTVYCLASETREAIWPLEGNTFDARSRVIAPLSIDESGVYVPSEEGKLHCLNRTNGQIKWQWFATGPLEHGAVLLSDTVYIADPLKGIVAIDKIENPEIKKPQYNRKERWARKDLIQILSQDDKYTYAIRSDHAIVALDKKTGEPKFASRRNDLYTFATNTKDSTIYAATPGGRIIAIRPVLTPGSTGEIVLNDSTDRLSTVDLHLEPIAAAN